MPLNSTFPKLTEAENEHTRKSGLPLLTTLYGTLDTHIQIVDVETGEILLTVIGFKDEIDQTITQTAVNQHLKDRDWKITTQDAVERPWASEHRFVPN